MIGSIIVTIVFVAGCSITTTGEGSWEIYGGIRTKQISETPTNVEIKPVDSFIWRLFGTTD